MINRKTVEEKIIMKHHLCIICQEEYRMAHKTFLGIVCDECNTRIEKKAENHWKGVLPNFEHMMDKAAV
jgi:hypothetical protein